MTMEQYVNDIAFKLGGQAVEVELSENGGIAMAVNAALQEIQTYIDTVKYATIPFARVIDLSNYKVSSITQVLRANNMGNETDLNDAFYLQQYRINSGINGMADYRSYLLQRQIKNTLKTDLHYRWDEFTKRLYVSATFPEPTKITIVYIPKFETVDEVVSPFWIDKLKRLALALSKEALGRIRGKYKLSNALYELDGDQLLSEAQAELTAIRQELQASINKLSTPQNNDIKINEYSSKLK